MNNQTKSCKVCQNETNFSNGLCSYCYNLGFHGLTKDGVIVSISRLKSYLSDLPGADWITPHLEHLQNLSNQHPDNIAEATEALKGAIKQILDGTKNLQIANAILDELEREYNSENR